MSADGHPRDSKRDLRDFIEICERADRDGAIDGSRLTGQQLIEAMIIYRKWWS